MRRRIYKPTRIRRALIKNGIRHPAFHAPVKKLAPLLAWTMLTTIVEVISPTGTPSWPQMGVPVGLITSTIVVNIVQASSGANFFTGAWNAGWRIPFFISALLILVGLYIRLRILETPLFAQIKAEKREAQAPIIDAFRHSTPEILLSAGARFVEQAHF